ncbi:MAG: CorA family divalent cation transporter [bacterium]
MIKQIKYQDITWLDIESPTKTDLDSLIKDFDIHPIVVQDLNSPSMRSKVDVYDNFIYLVLHFPVTGGRSRADTEADDSIEVDFVLGKDFIITTHYENVDSLSEFSKIFEANGTLSKAKSKMHAGHIFYYIIRQLYQSLEQHLESVNHNLKRSEKSIFSGKEIETVKTLSVINRNLIDFRWALKYHREVLNSLELACKDFYGPKFEYHINSIIGEYEKIWNILDSNRETFNDLRRTNDSLLAIKTSEAIKSLTAIAFFTFTISTLAAIFGMNMKHNPFNDFPYDFWVMIAIMGIITFGVFIAFRKRKWL